MCLLIYKNKRCFGRRGMKAVKGREVKVTRLRKGKVVLKNRETCKECRQSLMQLALENDEGGTGLQWTAGKGPERIQWYQSV